MLFADMSATLAQYSTEFLIMAAAHLFAVASPGPDFAIVMKHSISFGKRTAIITSVGIAAAIFVHIAYALAGIGIVIKSSPWLYQGLIALAAGFLIYLGFGAICSVASNKQVSDGAAETGTMTDKKAFALGFLTNGLNPKATLFFLSLFTVIVDAQTPFLVKSIYGVYLAIATFIWFLLLSLLLTRPAIRQFFNERGYLFDRIMGWVLIALAVNIIRTELFA